MSKVLLINPSYQGSYGNAKASIVNPILPTLGLATIAASAIQRSHEVKILDLSWRQYDYNEIKEEVNTFKPDIVGITATTPLVNQLRDISVLVKDISNQILVVGGGPHPSALPKETLRQSMLDVVVVGEADFSFAELCDRVKLEDIKGIYFRKGNEIKFTGNRPPISNLDDLPMPAWELYDLDVYKKHMSRLLSKHPPAVMAEFSRGCVYKCDFCASKMTMALGYRKKSPKRCAAEVKYMYDLGFREFMLADDIFTSDQNWANEVCKEIIALNIDIAWSCTNGIRVESANENLFKSLRKSGCYRLSFGFESGNNDVLKAFGKGGKASIEKGQEAVKMAREAGIDVNGYFMLGLSADNKQSMRDTIEFARLLPLDMLKFGIAIAFPGTKMFDEYSRKGLIKSFDWDDYHIYTKRPLFAHETLPYETIVEFMSTAYNRAIFTNVKFIARRMWRGIRTGEFFWDGYYFLKFLFMPSTIQAKKANYYAEERWPQWDFLNLSETSSYQTVRKTLNTKSLGLPAS